MITVGQLRHVTTRFVPSLERVSRQRACGTSRVARPLIIIAGLGSALLLGLAQPTISALAGSDHAITYGLPIHDHAYTVPDHAITYGLPIHDHKHATTPQATVIFVIPRAAVVLGCRSTPSPVRSPTTVRHRTDAGPIHDNLERSRMRC